MTAEDHALLIAAELEGRSKRHQVYAGIRLVRHDIPSGGFHIYPCWTDEQVLWILRGELDRYDKYWQQREPRYAVTFRPKK